MSAFATVNWLMTLSSVSKLSESDVVEFMMCEM